MVALGEWSWSSGTSTLDTMRRTRVLAQTSSSAAIDGERSETVDDGNPLETLAVAVGAGVLCVVGGPAPTGQSVIDALLVGALVTYVTWFGAVVPVRFAGAVVLIAGSLTLSWPGMIVGALAYVVSARLAVSRRSSKIASAVLAGVALNLSARSEFEVFLGASTIIAVLLALSIVVRAYPRQTGFARRTALGVGLTLIVGPILSMAVFALPAIQSQDDLREGERFAQEGLDLLGDGDLEDAEVTFQRAAAAFARAEDRLTDPLGLPAAAVPVLAQHRHAATEVSGQAAASTELLASELAKIDLDRLTVSDGRINLEAIRALEEPLVEIQERVGRLGDTIDAADSRWLVRPARERLADLSDDIDVQLERSDEIISVVRQAPALLGGEGQRVYFMAFTTPAEARGLGGFMGNWAEITVQDGNIELTDFGRSDDLDDAAAPGERTVTGPTDWLERYGEFGFDSGPAGGVGSDPWKNVTLSPSMSSTGQVIAELYPQSGGRPVNGVFVLDVFTVAQLLEFTGPIELPDGQGTLTAESAPKFLLNDQYELTDTTQRVDVLEVVSRDVFDTLLSTDLPPARELIDTLGPLVEQGRLAAYATDEKEQELIEQVGLGGTLANPSGRDGLAIVFNNAIGNKIDFFLRSFATYSVVAERDENTARARLEIVLDNEAPVFGETNYVIGNPLGYPDGTNRTYLSVFTRLPVRQTEIDGATVLTEQETEQGYFVTSLVVELAAKESRTVTFEMSGPLDLTDGYDLVLRSPPTARPLQIDSNATLTGGGLPDEIGSWTATQAGSFTAALGGSADES